MIVNNLESLGKGLYLVTIDGKDYTLNEEVILKYRLVKNKEYRDNIIDEILLSNDMFIYYNKAATYCIKYGTNKRKTYDHLVDKGVSCYNAKKIVDLLVERKILNEVELLKSSINYYIHNKYGIVMIKHKLIEKGYNINQIDEYLQQIDYDSYYECLNSLYRKIAHNYDKFDDFTRKMKIINYLTNRGYTKQDIETLDI